MPTGYTAKLTDGEQTFEDYLIGCAHAFGALITLRDAPGGVDAPIPTFEPRTYSRDALAKAKTDLAEAEAWTEAEASQLAYERWRSDLAAYEAEAEKRAGIRARQNAMLAQVDAWEPPSVDHEGLKRFMREQIEICAGEGSMDHHPIPSLMSATEFKAAAIERARREIIYNTKHWREQQERAAERNEWVRLLYQSIAS